MMGTKSTNKSKAKTTAAQEKVAREARLATKAPRKSKAARQAIEAAEALKRNAKAADPAAAQAEAQPASTTQSKPSESREAEITRARELGIELAENEFLSPPENLTEGAKVKEIVRRNGAKLPQSIFRVELLKEAPKTVTEVLSTKSRSGKLAKKDDSQRAKAWAKQGVSGDRAQAVLDKLKKGTRSKPILAAKELNDHERHLARRLFAQGQIQRDKFEQGIGYFV